MWEKNSLNTNSRLFENKKTANRGNPNFAINLKKYEEVFHEVSFFGIKVKICLKIFYGKKFLNFWYFIMHFSSTVAKLELHILEIFRKNAAPHNVKAVEVGSSYIYQDSIA